MNRYLLDTNIVLFLLRSPKELERNVFDILNDYNNLFYVSTISVQEMIQLYKNGKIKTNWKKAEEVLLNIQAMNIELLPVKKEHLLAYSQLLTLDSHKDPNDHVIISQAIAERITLISSDHKFEHYTTQKLSFIFNSR